MTRCTFILPQPALAAFALRSASMMLILLQQAEPDVCSVTDSWKPDRHIEIHLVPAGKQFSAWRPDHLYTASLSLVPIDRSFWMLTGRKSGLWKKQLIFMYSYHEIAVANAAVRCYNKQQSFTSKTDRRHSNVKRRFKGSGLFTARPKRYNPHVRPVCWQKSYFIFLSAG